MDLFLFTATNKKFTNFKSFNNHVRSYALKNNLDLKTILKENYDIVTKNKNKLCKYCGEECDYKNYIIGYINPCYSQSCYKNFVDKNIDYYSKQFKSMFYDLYDNVEYKCYFSKRYFDIVKEHITDNKNFNIEKKCLVCNRLFDNISIFSRDIRKKTCSDDCKFKQISSKVRKKNISNYLFDDLNFDINDKIKLNHYIFENKKYPSSDKYETSKNLNIKYKNYPELKLPLKNSKVYYSKKFDMYFYRNNDFYKNNSLYEYLGNSYENYLNYHIENKLGKTTCPGCNKSILFKDVFDSKLIKREYCNKECYYNSLKGKKVSSDIKKKQSNIIKEKIREGKYTPTITNSWCKSKTKVYIDGEEKNVRSSWEALFWLLNPKMEYEKIRIPYISVDGNKKIYITDFYCEETSTVYEIKPKNEQNNKNNLIKKEYAINYCNENKLHYVIVNENYFIKELESHDLNSLFNNMENKTINNLIKSFKGAVPKLAFVRPNG